MENLAQLRAEYARASLDAGDVDPDPIKQFTHWLNDAVNAEIREPNAMSLATVNASGRPSSRIVLLKGMENGRFTFYTNYQSSKANHLGANPACALTFHWSELERQVRIEGIAGRVDAERSDRYFHSRPRGAQLGAWASPQSSLLASREILEERMKKIEQRFKNEEFIPRPKQWGGYEVEPLLIEFWQGRPNRLHDRIQYILVEMHWRLHRLAP